MTRVCTCRSGSCSSPAGCSSAGNSQEPRCLTCHRKSPTSVCGACYNRAENQLAEIPSLLNRLAHAAVGSPPGLVEFVSGGAFGSRPPVAVDALTLTAYTPEAIGMELTDPQPPVGAAGDSIPLWVIAWATVWRHRFGHHQPAGVRVVRPATRATVPANASARPEAVVREPVDRCGMTDLPPHMCAHCRGVSDPIVEAESHTPLEGPVARTPREPAEYAAAVAAQLEEQARHIRYMARVVLGLQVARVPVQHGPRVDKSDPNMWRRLDHDGADDGLAEHWTARFGQPREIRRIMTDLAYLATWLDPALAEFDDADQFVTGLRSLVAAARSTVGKRSDVVRLGRCPETVTDRDTGEDAPCGAWLARDAMVSVVICPRCRTETPEKGLLMLARRMREVYGTSAERGAWT